MRAIVTKEWDETDGTIECVYGPFASLEAAEIWADERNKHAYPYGYHAHPLRAPFALVGFSDDASPDETTV